MTLLTPRRATSLLETETIDHVMLAFMLGSRYEQTFILGIVVFEGYILDDAGG